MADASRLETASFVITGGRISRNRDAKDKTKQSKRLRETPTPELSSKRKKTKAAKVSHVASTPQPDTFQHLPPHLLSPMCSPNLDSFPHWGLRGNSDRMLPLLDMNGSPQTRSFTKQFKAMATQLEMDHQFDQPQQTKIEPIPGLSEDIDLLAKARSAWSLVNAPKTKKKDKVVKRS
jgi:hypothetical protein